MCIERIGWSRSLKVAVRAFSARFIGAVALLLISAPLASAADRFWVGEDAFWEQTSHWSTTAGGAGGASLPANGDNAFIIGTAALNITRDDQSPPPFTLPGLALLRIDNTSAAATTTLSFRSAANPIVAQNMDVGSSGHGAVNHTAGTLTVANQLTLGVNAGSTGTYTLSQADGTSALNTTVWTDVGEFGTGIFNLKAGIHTTGNLAVGVANGSNGTYNLTGGTLNTTTDAYVGYGSTGTFNQSAGTHTAGTLTEGLQFVGVGTYALSGTGALTLGLHTIGNEGAGHFNQSGGIQTVTKRLQLGAAAGGVGTLDLSGGTLTAPNVFAGGTDSGSFGKGTITLTGGTMTVPAAGVVKVWNANSKLILDGGTLSTGQLDLTDWASRLDFRRGTLSLTGAGTSTGTNDLIVGNGATAGTATLNLSAGNLNVGGTTWVNNTAAVAGTMSQTGGTHTTGNLFIGNGGLGTYTLSGGTLTSGTFTSVGRTSGGTFTQSGGTHGAFVVIVGDLPAGNGTYNMTGATAALNTTFLTVGAGGAGVFSQSAGTTTVSSFSPFGEQVGATGTLNLSGGTFAAPNVYAGGGQSTAGGTGTLNLTGGTMTVPAAGTVKVWNAASGVTIDGGTLSTGKLELPNWNRLNFKKGTLNLTGGGSTNPGDLFIQGDNPGAAVLNLSAGTLGVGGTTFVGSNTSAGTAATFNQTGGTHHTGGLSVGLGATTVNYNLSGAAVLSVTGAEEVGSTTAGTLTQTGGSNTAGDLSVGFNETVVGTYALSAGTLTASASETLGLSGNGTLNQSGGTHTITGSAGLRLGQFAGATGTLNLSGGTLATPSAYAGGSDGDAGGAGFLNLTGGTMTVPAAGVIKVWSNSSVLKLNGGTLSTGRVELPEWDVLQFVKGTLSLTGGNSTAPGDLVMQGTGAIATLNLVAGTLGVGGTAFVGTDDKGAVINQSGTATASITTLSLGIGAPNTSTYSLSGTGSLTTTLAVIGGSSTGIFNQTGGTHTAAQLRIGNNLGVSGTYALSAGATLSVSTAENVGLLGTGTLNQTGGTHTITGSDGLSLGAGNAATGIVSLSGGTLNTPNAFLGGNAGFTGGAGTLNLTGGTMTVPAAGVVKSWNANGKINLDGGTLNAGRLDLTDWLRLDFKRGTLNLTGTGTSTGTSNFNIGTGLAGGTAILNLTAGTLDVPGTTVVNNSVSVAATLNQTGGTHTAGGLSVGVQGQGTYLLSPSGTLTVAGPEKLGPSSAGGVGTVTQTGGTHTIGGVLTLGGVAGATGTFNLSGGTVTSPNVFAGGTASAAGGTGTINLTGGTMTVPAAGQVKVWNAASKVLIGGGSLSTGSILAPTWDALVFGKGTLNLTGGTSSNAGALRFGRSASGTATLNLSAGTLATGSSLVVGDDFVGVLNQTGGTVTVGAALEIAFATGSGGTALLAGGTASAPDAFVGGGLSASGGTGTLALQGGNLTVPAAGSVKIWNANSSITMNGGALSAGSIITPSWANVFFTKGTLSLTGGVTNAPGNLNLLGDVDTPAVPATLNISGTAAVTADSTSIAQFGNAAANLIGGSHTTGSLRLAEFAGSTGAYTMAAGTTLTVNETETVGFGGNGTFTQNGGTQKVTGLLNIARESTAVGTFNLAGGTLTVPNVELGGLGSNSPGAAGTLNLTGGTMTTSGTVKVWNAASSISVSNGGVLNAGALDLPAGGPATMLSFSGGTWQHSGASAAMNHDFTLNSAGGTFNVQAAASILTLGGAASGAGALTKTGPGTLKITGSLASAAGLTVSAGKADLAATQLLKTLTVNSGGSAVISAGVLTVGDDTTASPLTLGNGAAAGHIDLTTRGVVIDYAPGAGNDAAALASVRSQIINGFNHGTWNGPGIASSSAAADSSNRAIGYALASEVLGPTGGTFMGKSEVDASSVLVRFTVAGDANLDGTVGFADLVAVAQHYGISDGSPRWSAGDLNYDGDVGFADLVAVAQHYGGVLPANPIGGAPADFNADLAAAFASVPEPGAGVLMMVGATIFLRRRPRAKPVA